MAKLTTSVRKQIVLDFVAANGGIYNPARFVEFVRAAGPTHPAYDWFEWSDQKAAVEYRIDRARQFLTGLVIKFEVRTVSGGEMKISHSEMPLLLSPQEGRSNGGGYTQSNPSDPEHMAEFCRQAASTLSWFANRYAAAIAHVGGDASTLDDLRGALDAVTADAETVIAAE